MSVPMNQFNQQRLDHIREPLRDQLQETGLMKHEGMYLGVNGVPQRPSYHKEMDTAKEELTHFRSKLDQWRITYDRDIGKAKQDLAMLSPRLKGLGLASRIHQLREATASRLNIPRMNTPGMNSPRCSDPRSKIADRNLKFHSTVQALRPNLDGPVEFLCGQQPVHSTKQ